MRSGGRVVEGARLESEYTSKAYRGFESLPLRHLAFRKPPIKRYFPSVLAISSPLLFPLCFISSACIQIDPGASMLTEMQVKNAKAKERDYKLADSEGLYLFVTAKGHRSGRIKYRFAGRERRLALGA
jgi:hypothetical protein